MSATQFGDGRLSSRFWEKVTVTSGGCWEWTGATLKAGYGIFVHEGTTRIAHRVAFTVLDGPVPDGLQLDHLCRVRNCVNPLHLEAVTARENLMRGDTAAARNARKTHCLRGHPLSGPNLKVVHRGHRVERHCRACLNGLRRKGGI